MIIQQDFSAFVLRESINLTRKEESKSHKDAFQRSSHLKEQCKFVLQRTSKCFYSVCIVV